MPKVHPPDEFTPGLNYGKCPRCGSCVAPYPSLTILLKRTQNPYTGEWVEHRKPLRLKCHRDKKKKHKNALPWQDGCGYEGPIQDFT